MTWAEDAVIRLRRTDWDVGQPFADELALIFAAFPGTTTGPATVSPNADGSNPFTLPPLTDLNFPAIDFPSLLGGLDPANPLQTDSQDTPGGDGQTTSEIKNVWLRYSAPALVNANNGDGTYACTLYPNGALEPTVKSDVLVTALNADATITANTYVLVSAILKLKVKTDTKHDPTGGITGVSTSIKILSQVYYCQAPGAGSSAMILFQGISDDSDIVASPYILSQAQTYPNGPDGTPGPIVAVRLVPFAGPGTSYEFFWGFAQKLPDGTYVAGINGYGPA